MSIRDVYLLVFQPCQREVGRLWEAGRITVAQEHYCTAATQVIMSQLAPRLFATERNGRRAVVACVAGESHEVGPRMVADLLELGGWDTIYLGGNVPLRGVVQALAEHRADLLAVSATMTYHLPAVIDLIAAVRAEPACAGVRVMVGGRLFDAEPGLWRRVGADGHPADADEVCRLADRLVSEPGGPADAGLRVAEGRRRDDPPAPAPPGAAGDLYDEMGLLNNEVVALNRELARKNAEVERLHAQVSRQAQRPDGGRPAQGRVPRHAGPRAPQPAGPAPQRPGPARPGRPRPGDGPWARDIMERQVRHLVRLVDDLLDVSRIMQGKLDLRTERCDLAAVVADAVETARPVIDAKRPRVERLAARRAGAPGGGPDPAGPGAREPAEQRRQVHRARRPHRLTAVPGRGRGGRRRAGHAASASPRRCCPRSSTCSPRWSDRLARSQGGLGIGLTPGEEPGRDARRERRGTQRGAGPGQRVRRPAPGPGGHGRRPGRRRIGSAAGAACPRRRILVVDDNVDAARSLARLLARLYGQEVRVAHDGPEALAVAEEFRPEVVLLDIGLPGMDGYEVARRLRERPEFEGTLLVALTGWGQESDVERSRAAGFDHHLVKPANPEAILELLLDFGASSAG